MYANDRRAPMRERDGQAMPDRSGRARAKGVPVHRVSEMTIDRDGELANPRALLVPARQHPGLIVLFRTDNGRVHAGHVPAACPVQAMEHALRAFRSLPSIRPVEGSPAGAVEPAHDGGKVLTQARTPEHASAGTGGRSLRSPWRTRPFGRVQG